MEKSPDLAGKFRADSIDSSKFLPVGLSNSRQAAHGFKENFLPGRTDSGHLVQFGRQGTFSAQASMKSNPETVCLITDLHEKKEHR